MFDCYWLRGNQPQPGVRASVPPQFSSLLLSLHRSSEQGFSPPNGGKQKAGREEGHYSWEQKRQQNLRNTGAEAEEGGMTEHSYKDVENPHVQVRVKGISRTLIAHTLSPERIKGPVGYSPLARKELDTTEPLSTHTHAHRGDICCPSPEATQREFPGVAECFRQTVGNTSPLPDQTVPPQRPLEASHMKQGGKWTGLVGPSSSLLQG